MAWILTTLCACALLAYGWAAQRANRFRQADENRPADAFKWLPGHLPLKLHVDHWVGPRHRAALNQAMAYWNSTSRLQLFVPIGSIRSAGSLVAVYWHHSADVYQTTTCIIDRCPCDHYAHTRYWFGQHGHITSCEVHINFLAVNRLGTERLFYQYVHELGHVLGLSDDNVKRSVMFDGPPDVKPVVTAMDRDTLMGLYGKEHHE